MKIEESAFNVLLEFPEGKEPNLCFYSGIKSGDKYFPVSITGAGKLPFEQGVLRYTVFSSDAAREAYDALTADQKALVDTYETLTTAESTYNTLKADNEAADEVKALIAAIGEVTYTTDPGSKDKIEAARTAYEELTVPQKELVENYEVLEAAEATYAELEAEANKGLSGGAIAGIVIGCVAFVAIVCFLLWFFLFKKKKEDKDEPKNDQTDEPKE